MLSRPTAMSETQYGKMFLQVGSCPIQEDAGQRLEQFGTNT